MDSDFGRKRTPSRCKIYTSSAYGTTYLFKYAKIRRHGPKGICQFALAARGARQTPHLFFTCPGCGEINRFYISFKMLEYTLKYSTTIRSCHNCHFCRKALPFNIDLPAWEVKKRFLAVAKEVP